MFKYLKVILLNCVATLLLTSFSVIAFGQADSSVWVKKPEVSLTGFVDIYYAYDFNEPKTNRRQGFIYNHNRHNEFNLNLGIAKISAQHSKYRANLALQAGTYVQDNYAAEPSLLQHVYEGNAGLSLNKKNNLWVDAGIFTSHIGFESAISNDNWTLTRSLCAENSPYYLSGAKLTYNPNEHWELAAIVCNGWQRIKKVSGNSLPAAGTQIKYKNGEKLIINWSTFAGTDDPDATRRMRYFNNVYTQWQLTGKLGIIAGFDIGLQQISKNSEYYDSWYTPALLIRYSWSDKWSTTLRGEYFDDSEGVIIATGTKNNFITNGVSLNADYTPAKYISCRLEGRLMNSVDDIFQKHTTMVKDNLAIVSSIAVAF